MKRYVLTSLLGITLACVNSTAFAEMVTRIVGFENLQTSINNNGGAWSDFSDTSSDDGITIGERSSGEHLYGWSYNTTPFTVDGITFYNDRTEYGSWSGTGLSTQTNKTIADGGYTNDMASITGSGDKNSSAYGVIYGDSSMGSRWPGMEGMWNYGDEYDYRPSMTFENGAELVSMQITNTTYTVNLMMNGGDFGTTPGGILDLLIYGYGADGNEIGTITLNLGNENGVLEEWTFVDLSKLSSAAELRFAFESDVHNSAGLLYPVYFAFDDITYRIESANTTPEPATLAILGLGLAGLGLARRRK